MFGVLLVIGLLGTMLAALLVLPGEFALQVAIVLTLPVAVVLATGTIVVALPRITALAVTFIVGRRVAQRIRNETIASGQTLERAVHQGQ